jgi:photosystem II stability/assembly factor-like uncharacterized protein
VSITGTVWTPIGPSPIAEGGNRDNGLVTTIAVNPNNPQVIYIGSAGGGVWRTDDGGLNWKPIFDRQLSLGIGEPNGIAIDPNNTSTLYVGTSGRVTRQPAAGLYKSNDGGASWIRLGSGFPAGNTGNANLLAALWINVVFVDSTNSNIVYVGSTGGMFRSVDGGQNWTPGTNGFGDVRSLTIDPTSAPGARTLYAGISGRGAFRSNDGGQNWTQVLSAATPVVAAIVGPSPAGIGKVIVALAPPTLPANPGGIQVLYVTMQGTSGAPDPVGVFQSTNQGAAWTQRAAAGLAGSTQGGYSFHMAVDPDSPGDGLNDIVFLGTVRQQRSTDSAANFANVPVLHADTHAWTFVPQPTPPAVIYCGNDGGINRSTDGGGSWISLSAGGLQTSLIYNLDLKADATASISVAAVQDNEVQTTAGAAKPTWNATQGGDGWDVAYDRVSVGRVFCTSGFWSPAPCTRVFRSTDDGATFPTEITPWGTTSDAGCYLAPVATDPSKAGVVYVSGSQNLWQSRDAGGTWRILSPFVGTGNIDVARANGNNVVIAVGNQVFVSTNALAPTVGPPAGVTFTNITRNLPSRTVSRVKFDPADPGTLYAVLGGFNGGAGQIGHVFRTTITAATWTDISPPVDLPYSAVALGAKTIPTTIFAGTDLGVLRSVNGGASWTVLDDIRFPRAPVLDLSVSEEAGVLRAATYGRGVFEFSKPTGPAIAVDLEDGFDFGTVCKGPKYLTLEIFNVGVQDLIVDSVQTLMGSSGFAVLPSPGTPLVIGPGDHVDFTVRYVPTVRATPEIATIRIVSNDPGAPIVDIAAIGLGGTGALETLIADTGNIGNACLGSFAEEPLTLLNNGPCPLSVTGVSCSSAEFSVPHVVAYPLLIGAGASVSLPIRFEPVSLGAKSAVVIITSDDPSGPKAVNVSGTAPAPRLALLIADHGRFGKACVNHFADKDLTLNNSGRCTLTITNIASSSTDFAVPMVISYPLKVAAGASMQIPIRFQPTSFGAKSATLTVTSDDPAGPQSVTVSGEAPSGKLAVTGSAEFGGVECCAYAARTLSLCNVGECDLHVSSVALTHRRRHFKLISNVFPATVRPGSSLDVVVRFKATCEPCKPCSLIIMCDDPDSPKRELELLAYSLCCMDCECRECGCKCGEPCRCKDECHRGRYRMHCHCRHEHPRHDEHESQRRCGEECGDGRGDDHHERGK